MTTPILLIPGLSCTAEIYAPHIASLWRAGPVTVANHTLGDTIAEIAAAILADAPPRFMLAGFSMGGYISFEILRQAPERVARLALIDTQARPDSPEATQKRRDAIRLVELGRFDSAMSQTFANAVHPDNRGDAGLKALHMRMARAVGAETYIRHQNAIIARADSRPGLGDIAVPTTIIVGEGDAITPPALAEEMQAAIPGATLVVVPEAGHMALAEQQAVTGAALEAWALPA